MNFQIILLIKTIIAATDEKEENSVVEINSKQDKKENVQNENEEPKLIIGQLKENFKGDNPYEQSYFGFVFPKGVIPREIYPGDEYSGNIIFPGYVHTFPGDNFFQSSRDSQNLETNLQNNNNVSPQAVKDVEEEAQDKNTISPQVVKNVEDDSQDKNTISPQAVKNVEEEAQDNSHVDVKTVQNVQIDDVPKYKSKKRKSRSRVSKLRNKRKKIKSEKRKSKQRKRTSHIEEIQGDDPSTLKFLLVFENQQNEKKAQETQNPHYEKHQVVDNKPQFSKLESDKSQSNTKNEDLKKNVVDLLEIRSQNDIKLKFTIRRRNLCLNL